MGVHGFCEVDNKDATKSESTGHCIKKQAPTTAYAEKKAKFWKLHSAITVYLNKKTQAKTWGTQVLKSFGVFFGKRVSIFFAHLIYQSIVTNMISKQDLLCSAKDRFFFLKIIVGGHVMIEIFLQHVIWVCRNTLCISLKHH